MKTKYEFRKQALELAKQDPFGYDSVACWGLYKDYEVYSACCKSWKNNPPCIGMPSFILVNEKGAKWAVENPMDIMKDCKKIPSVIFEYDSIGWYATTFTVTLFAGGILQKVIHHYSKLEANGVCSEIDFDALRKNDEEVVLITNSQLAKDLKAIVKKHHDVLRKIDRDIYNPMILDGVEETIRFGRLKFRGYNILTESYEDWKKSTGKNPKEYEVLMMEDLHKIQIAFNEIKDKINSYSKACL